VNRTLAELYLAAARNDPFLASFIRVLDEHQMGHRTEVAPHDWEEAFEQLFNLGLIPCDQFNRIDFKHAFRSSTPPVRDVEAALAELARLREAQDRKENPMSGFDGFDKKDFLTLRPGPDSGFLEKPDGHDALESSVPLPSEFLAPRGNRAAPLGSPAPLEPTRYALPPSSRNGIERTRPAVTDIEAWNAPGKEHRAERASQEGSATGPRSCIDGFKLKVFCCDEELKLQYHSGRSVSHEFDGAEAMGEFIFRSVCPRCDCEGHLTFVRAIPKSDGRR
jgi:hypothetical protein